MTVQGRQQAYSAGNKTYGFGRSNPTSGPVDPLGYKERDAIRRVMTQPLPSRNPRTDQSITGIPESAWTARQRQYADQYGLSGTRVAPAPTGTMSWMPPIAAPAPQVLGAPTPGIGQQVQTMRPPIPNAPGNNQQVFTGGQPPGPNNVEGNTGVPNGYIDPAGPPGMQTGGIPNQQQHLQDLINAKVPAHQHQFMPGYDTAKHNLETDAFEQQRQLEQNAPAAYDHLTDVYAGRGLLHSGKFATDLGAAHSQTADQLSAIQRALANGQVNLDNQDLNYNQGLAQQEAGNYQQQLQNQIALAGTLGLDQSQQQQPDFNSILQQVLGSQQQAAPAALPAAPVAPAPVMYDAPRTMASFDPHSQNILHGGGTVKAGNGYVYRSVNGVPTRVA